MKVLNRKIAIALLFMFALILPMGIGVVHAFHEHDTIECLAENESHFHSEALDCEQLHYFSQTVNDGILVETIICIDRIFEDKEYYSAFSLIQSFSKADPDRGPPVINVL